ncbi:PREDICTED: late embryogenesis abundant protein At1g64065-like [Nelumbo nucifera]|uniref:Late embryogenesis abundant protein At1g64065-like n=2 Tax=Nelumbo nucifera TaxID=4432 RepID=A0A1U7ZK03_NELNU|nr:PREDICTED: late embryogenesis abundant protein At1g64065-like [Nelumbo nucifera]DAD43218.1 TPA_asm: hypothetical protein HUJ06_001448 [Nelumbo nucifera]
MTFVDDSEVGDAERRKPDRKCWIYVLIAIGVAVLILLMVVIALFLFRIRRPSVRLSVVELRTVSIDSLKLKAEVTIKNENFGYFLYERSALTISHGGVGVGQATIDPGRATARSTKRMHLDINATSTHFSSPSVDLTLSSYAVLIGDVHIFRFMKTPKSTEMRCTMRANLIALTISDLSCIDV